MRTNATVLPVDTRGSHTNDETNWSSNVAIMSDTCLKR